MDTQGIADVPQDPRTPLGRFRTDRLQAVHHAGHCIGADGLQSIQTEGFLDTIYRPSKEALDPIPKARQTIFQAVNDKYAHFRHNGGGAVDPKGIFEASNKRLEDVVIDPGGNTRNAAQKALFEALPGKLAIFGEVLFDNAPKV